MITGKKNMTWKRTLDIFPSEWNETQHENELNKELELGDKAKIIVDSQFIDDNEPRRIGQIGTVVEINTSDEWSYKVRFDNGNDNWFKRYHLQKEI
jgi:ribosomal protein L21E